MRAIRATCGRLIVAVMVLVSVGCAGRTVPDLPDLPPVVDGVEQDVYAAGAKALGVLTAAARLVDAISRVEDQAARQGLIPANADAVFDSLIVQYADASDAAVSRILAGVSTWAELRAVVQPVIDRVDALKRYAEQVGVIRQQIGEWIDALRRIVTGGLSEAIGAAAFGGTR